MWIRKAIQSKISSSPNFQDSPVAFARSGLPTPSRSRLSFFPERGSGLLVLRGATKVVYLRIMGNEPSPDNDYRAEHAALLVRSFQHWTDRSLLPVDQVVSSAAEALYHAPMVVVSHGTEPDPIFNYGNLSAQKLFAMSWGQLTRLPSRCSAEVVEQSERERLMRRVREHGYIADYRGVRISATGQRFFIEQAVVWNLLDAEEKLMGQAAVFDHWTPITD
jgi:hypothetical protein